MLARRVRGLERWQAMAICGRTLASSDDARPIDETIRALELNERQECASVRLAGARFAACDDASLGQGPGDRVVLFDGRIDNGDEIRRALNLGIGEDVAPPALLLRAWQAWGDELCRHVVGDYAFATWDGATRRLTMAVDPSGLRPLFYRADGNAILFASEQRGILADPATPIAIDERQLAAWLALLPRDEERSFFDGIRRVPPGSRVIWRNGAVTVERWWRPECLPLLKLRDDADYVAALRGALDQAVRCRLGTGEALGSNLSGGLDSSAVTAVAARALAEQGRPLVAFTAAPAMPVTSRPGWFGDEWSHAADVAAMHPNIDHVRVANDADGLLETLQRRETGQDWPLLNPVNAIWVDAIERDAARRGLGAVLVGAMGNYSISHHGNDALGAQLRGGRPLAALATANARHRATGVGWKSLLREGAMALLPEALSGRLRREAARHELDDYSVIAAAFLDESGLSEAARDTAGDLSNIAGRDSRRLRMLGMQRGDHLGIQFGSARRLYGVEIRDPTSDRRLVELCLTIPDERFSHGGIPRNLLRRAMVGLLPDSVRNERRRGQQSADWQTIFDRAIPGLRAHLALLRDSPLASRALELDRIASLLDHWPEACATASPGALHLTYRLAVARGIAAGSFIRRAEQAAASRQG